MEDQFLFERDDEAKKKKQIETSLKIDKEKPIYNYLGKINDKIKKRYKSIFLNKHMENVLNYIYGNIKDRIITEQIKDQEEIAMSNLKKNEELKK